jgi:lipoprotein-anchoring transpeptidase ErfK/SrfK
LSANRHAVRRAWLCAPPLLALATATAFAGLGGSSARAEELKISTNARMMEVVEVTVDVPAEAAAPASKQAWVPKVVARIDLSDQTMTVYVDERLAHVFKVSTGRRGYGTPTGRWSAKWLSPRHRSKKYHNAPMPWSVFFHRGYAVHGTTAVRRLGRPASHGCVRLDPANAKIFYKLVQENGKQNTLVSIVR